MRLLKKKKMKLFPFLIKSVIVIFVLYLVFTLVSQQAQINNKRKNLDELNSKLQVQNVKNEELKQFTESCEKNNDEYIERIARESLDLSKKGERVFINISGN